MTKIVYVLLSISVLVAVVVVLIHDKEARWVGVDETVVEHYARQAGHPPRKPYLDTDKGDLLLFLFLAAGAAGGFIGGYCFRSIFPSDRTKSGDRTSRRTGEQDV